MIFHEKDERKMKTSTKNKKKKTSLTLKHVKMIKQIKHVFKARLQVIKLLSARIKSKHEQASKLSDDQAFKHVEKV